MVAPTKILDVCWLFLGVNCNEDQVSFVQVLMMVICYHSAVASVVCSRDLL